MEKSQFTFEALQQVSPPHCMDLLGKKSLAIILLKGDAVGY